MKRCVILLLLLVSATSFAQNFTITYGETEVGETFNAPVNSPDEDFELCFTITNTSTVVDSIFLEKQIIAEVEGSDNMFCIAGNCYDAPVSTTPLILNPGESSGRDFHFLYNPNNEVGTTTIRYIFTSGSFKDSVVVNYIYDPSGIAESPVKVSEMSAYPNPANDFVTVQYDLSGCNAGTNARVILTNLVGSRVLSNPIHNSNGRIKLDISNLDSGIYFYSIEANGKVISTKKLIVK